MACISVDQEIHHTDLKVDDLPVIGEDKGSEEVQGDLGDTDVEEVELPENKQLTEGAGEEMVETGEDITLEE